MELDILLGLGQKYGEYKVLPLTLKEIVEADKRELASLLLNPVWALEDAKIKKIFAKWIEKKIRKDGQIVTLDDLIKEEYPAPWLHDMMTILLESSGFGSANRE